MVPRQGNAMTLRRSREPILFLRGFPMYGTKVLILSYLFPNQWKVLRTNKYQPRLGF